MRDACVLTSWRNTDTMLCGSAAALAGLFLAIGEGDPA